MPTTKVNLSQMVDLAVGTPEVGAVNFNVLHTLLHAMLRRLNIVDVQADLNEFDRDFLSASKASELSNVDSGLNDDAEDGLSERSSSMTTATPRPSTGSASGRTPYHILAVKVSKMQEQIENITSVPSNKHLFEKTKTQYEEKPMGEMWLNMHMMSRVETNEKGIAKCLSIIEDMTKEIQDLIDEHKQQMDHIKGLNIDDLMQILNAMEKSMSDMNDTFNTLPSPDEYAKFVTRPELEDALQGIRKDLESILPSTDDSAQFVSWTGLEDALQGIRQDLESKFPSPDDFAQDKENLKSLPTEKVVIEMSSQTDPVPIRPTSSRSVSRGASPGPSGTLLEILEKLGRLGESHEALTERVEELEAKMRKMDRGALDGSNVSSELLEQLQHLKKQVDALAAARRQLGGEPLEPLELIAPPPSSRSVTSKEDLLLQPETEMHNYHTSAITSLSTRWEIKHGTNPEDEIRKIFNQNEPDKTRNLAYVINDQLHDIRDDIITLEEELKKQSNVVEIPYVQAESEPLGTLLGRTKSVGYKDMDQDALLKAQNANREEFKKLFAYCDELQGNKADKTEVYGKAENRALDKKVNHSLFNTTTSDINRMIKEILERMAESEDAWNQQCRVLSDDINGKLDRLELEPLKEWMRSKLNALNNKLKKQNQAPVEWADDDAAGIRRQLMQKYNCISCDRPIDMVPTGTAQSTIPSVSNHQALHPIRSPRPRITFEMNQIRQHANSRSNANFEERQTTKLLNPDQGDYHVHFSNDVFHKQRNASNDYAEMADDFATNRQCGGQHTTTYPHAAYPQKRYTKQPHLSNITFQEAVETNIYPLYKEEINVQGADGNIYKGRMNRLEAKLLSRSQDPSSMQRRDKSPMHKVRREGRPCSARMLHSPSPPSRNGSRPH